MKSRIEASSPIRKSHRNGSGYKIYPFLKGYTNGFLGFQHWKSVQNVFGLLYSSFPPHMNITQILVEKNCQTLSLFPSQLGFCLNIVSQTVGEKWWFIYHGKKKKHQPNKNKSKDHCHVYQLLLDLFGAVVFNYPLLMYILDLPPTQ